MNNWGTLSNSSFTNVSTATTGSRWVKMSLTNSVSDTIFTSFWVLRHRESVFAELTVTFNLWPWNLISSSLSPCGCLRQICKEKYPQGVLGSPVHMNRTDSRTLIQPWGLNTATSEKTWTDMGAADLYMWSWGIKSNSRDERHQQTHRTGMVSHKNVVISVGLAVLEQP